MRILVVRFRGIGDVLISWFGLETLAKEHEVIYCTSSLVAPLFPDDWVEVYAYDWVAHPLNVLPDLPQAVLDIEHDRLINMVNAVDWIESTSEYQTVSRSHQFARLMGATPSSYVRSVKVVESARQAAADYLWQFRHPIIVCQVDATSPTRLWPYWTQLSAILARQGMTVVWLGGQPCDTPPGILNYAGLTNTFQWIALLSLADVIVSTCTAAVHIGARLPNVKVVALYGSTDYRIFTDGYRNVKPVTNYTLPCAPCADWQTSDACYKQKYAPWCLAGLPPQKVAQAIDDALSAKGD